MIKRILGTICKIIKYIVITSSALCFIISVIVALNNVFNYSECSLGETYLLYLGKYKFDYAIIAYIISVFSIPVCVLGIIINIIRKIYIFLKTKTFSDFNSIIFWCILLVLCVISSYLYAENYIIQFGV